MRFREEFIVRFNIMECEKLLKEFSLQLDKVTVTHLPLLYSSHPPLMVAFPILV